MSGRGVAGFVGRLMLAGLLAMAIAGCTLEAMQRSDRIRHGAGDAVAANLESEAVNPMSGAMFNTRGLGANGAVVGTSDGSTGSTPATSGTTASGAP